jgi:hypothetical protein
VATTKDINDNLASASDTTLDLIVGIQQRIVDVNREFASVVAGLLPELPSWLQPSDTPDIPDTPDPKELVEQGFEFHTRLLEANKEFSKGLIEAWAQAVPAGATS